MSNLNTIPQKLSQKQFFQGKAVSPKIQNLNRETFENRIDYQQDFVAWLEQQSQFLKNKEFTALDIENLVEELQAMSRSEQRELKNRMIVLLMHLLKWQFQPEKNGESWQKTIREQRKQIGFLLEDSPSLKNYLTDSNWLEKVWAYAIKDAVQETGLAKMVFPCSPIWDTTQILDSEFYPADNL